MTIDHSGKTAVVTGAARGIGRAIAMALAENKARVAVLDLEGNLATSTAEAIANAHGVQTWAASMDVSSKEQVASVFAALREQFGTVDILVNNAGVTTNVGTVVELSEERWDRELAINLSGAFYCCRQVLPGMMERQWGRIVNISSVVGAMGGYGQAGYAACKAGLLGLTKTLALEYARQNITANAILPGLVNTAAAAAIPEPLRQRIINTAAMRRMAEPEEIAGVASFLASQAASYMNGSEVYVSGGCELFTF